MEQENMDITGTTDTEAVATGETQTQVEEKTFTQDEVNALISKRVGQLKNKYAYDPAEVEELKAFKESVEEEHLIKKQDFDKVLAKHRDKANTEIQQLRAELERIKVDGALINAASKAGAIAPEQVAKLLKESVRLESDGSVVVLDSDGNPQYDDNAEPYSLDKLVESFISTNQYFRAAGPSGVGSQSNTGKPSQASTNLADLDMTNPEHRALYKQMRKQGKI